MLRPSLEQCHCVGEGGPVLSSMKPPRAAGGRGTRPRRRRSAECAVAPARCMDPRNSGRAAGNSQSFREFPLTLYNIYKAGRTRGARTQNSRRAAPRGTLSWGKGEGFMPNGTGPVPSSMKPPRAIGGRGTRPRRRRAACRSPAPARCMDPRNSGRAPGNSRSFREFPLTLYNIYKAGRTRGARTQNSRRAAPRGTLSWGKGERPQRSGATPTE